MKSWTTVSHWVLEGKLHAILCRGLIALGREYEESYMPWRGLTDEETELVIDYFTRVSPPESGSEMLLKTAKGRELR